MKNYINCLVITLFGLTANAQTTTTQSRNSSNTAITAEQFITQAALGGMKEVETGRIAQRKAQNTRVKDFGAMMTKDHSRANTELMAIAKANNIKLPKPSEFTTATTTGANANAGTTTGSGSQGNNGTSGSTMGTGNSAGTTSGTGNTNNNTGTSGTNTTGNSSTTGNTGNTSTSSGTTTGNSGTMGSNNTSTTTQQQNNTQAGSTNGMSSTNTNDSLKMMTVAEVRSDIQQLEGLSGTQFDTAYVQMMIKDHQNSVALFERGATSSEASIKAFATKHLPTLRSHLQQVQSLAGNTTPSTGTTGNRTGNQ